MPDTVRGRAPRSGATAVWNRPRASARSKCCAARLRPFLPIAVARAGSLRSSSTALAAAAASPGGYWIPHVWSTISAGPQPPARRPGVARRAPRRSPARTAPGDCSAAAGSSARVRPRVGDRSDELDRPGEVLVGRPLSQLQLDRSGIVWQRRADEPQAGVGTPLAHERADLEREIRALPVDKRPKHDDFGWGRGTVRRSQRLDFDARMHDERLDATVQGAQLVGDSTGRRNDNRRPASGDRHEASDDRPRHKIVVFEDDGRANPRHEQSTECRPHPADDHKFGIEIADELANLATVTEQACEAEELVAHAPAQLQCAVTDRQWPHAGLGGRVGEWTGRTREADFALEPDRGVDEDPLRPAKNRRIAHEQDKSHDARRLPVLARPLVRRP